MVTKVQGHTQVYEDGSYTLAKDLLVVLQIIIGHTCCRWQKQQITIMLVINMDTWTHRYKLSHSTYSNKVQSR